MSEGDPLAAIRARFLDRLRADGEALARAIEAKDLGQVETLAHGLAGSAALLGFPEVGAAALAIDTAFGAGIAPSHAQTDALMAAIGRYAPATSDSAADADAGTGSRS